MRCHVCCAHARFYEFGYVSKFNELFNGIVLYPEEGSITETSVYNILQRLFNIILNSHLLTTLRSITSDPRLLATKIG